jgi:hypothetical protein
MPSKYAIGALALLLIIGGSGFGGWWVRGKADDSANLRAVQAAQAADRETQRQWAESYSQAVQASQKISAVRREITREITNNIEYRDRECFDKDLVEYFNRLANGYSN